MMKNLSYPTKAENNDAAGRLTGARILVMEKCFDALVDAMVEDGSDPANAAVVMLEHLAERFAGRRGS
jgi:hypothetical protein